MIRFVIDENFRQQILVGVLARDPSLNVVRVQDVGLGGATDEAILAWAAEQARIILTHDIHTMPTLAYDRITRGERMPGVFLVGRRLDVGRAIEDILLLAACSEEGEWESRVLYLPL